MRLRVTNLTLKPLTELIPMRYLERDLPSAVYSRLHDLMFVRDFDELVVKLDRASTWGASLLRELESGVLRAVLACGIEATNHPAMNRPE
jgi:hypothetical protein